jgi:hypothetical protein
MVLWTVLIVPSSVSENTLVPGVPAVPGPYLVRVFSITASSVAVFLSGSGLPAAVVM